MIKVGVIFGGESVEHEVSIISAIQAVKNLDKEKYTPVLIYITKDREMYTGPMLSDLNIYKDMNLLRRYATNVVMYVKDGRAILQKKKGLFKREVASFDIALPIVHGTNVEDGTIQGFLNLNGIPYVGSNVYSSAVGQDKVFMKDIFVSIGLRTPKYVWFFEDEYRFNQKEIIKQIETLHYPVIIKPARLGSSVGIEKANSKEKLDEAINEAIKYDDKILVEEVVPNLTEINVSILGNPKKYEASVLEQVMGTDEFLSYADKYIGGSKGKLKNKSSCSEGMLSTRRKIPADIDKSLASEITDMALKGARALNVQGVVRIDFLVDTKTKKAYINEANIIPGSLSFYLWEKKGKDYRNLLDDIITIAIKDYKNRSKKLFSFDSNILSEYKSSGAKKGFKKL